MGFPVKISVIIPVYNIGKFLSKCLDSCIRQTLYDVEFICINDGSTDNSGEILKSYAKIDPRFRIIEQENQGVSAARNVGIDKAAGEWIMFLDSDDFLEPKACERIWIESREEPTDIIIFGANSFPAYPQAGPWYQYVLRTPTCRFYSFEARVLFSTPGATPFIWHQAFSTEFLRRSGVKFHTEFQLGEDQTFQMELFPKGKNFSFIEDRLYNYRWYRENSLMDRSKKHPDERMEQHLHMISSISEYWDKNHLLDKYGRDFLCWILDFIVYDLQNKELKYGSKHARELREIIKKHQLQNFYQGLNRDYQRKWNILQKI